MSDRLPVIGHGRGVRGSKGATTDSTLRREVEMAQLRNTNARLRGVLLDVLRGPYISQEAVSLSLSTACHEMQHPKVRSSGACACGKKPA